jgi:hypothetical protein
MRTGPIDEGEGRGDEMLGLSAQDSAAASDMQPPSNGAPDDWASSVPLQFSKTEPCEGTTGLLPGVAISVEPGGMPAGCADRAASGDVMRMPNCGCMSDDRACAIAMVGSAYAIPAINDAHSAAGAIPRGLNRFAFRLLEARCSRICGAPVNFLIKE